MLMEHNTKDLQNNLYKSKVVTLKKHILKDMRIALDSAAELQLDLPGLAVARRLYDEVAARGLDECGTQALYQLYTAR